MIRFGIDSRVTGMMRFPACFLALLLATPALAAVPTPVTSRLQLTVAGAPGVNLGGAVASGDVNGDGYADLIVGASNDATNGPNSGIVYIYFGGPAADAGDVSTVARGVKVDHRVRTSAKTRWRPPGRTAGSTS